MKPEPLDMSENFLGRGVPGREILAPILTYYQAAGHKELPTLDQLVDWARSAKSQWKSDITGRPSNQALVPWVLKVVLDGVRMWVHRRPLGGSRVHIILKSFDLANRGATCQSTISTVHPTEAAAATSPETSTSQPPMSAPARTRRAPSVKKS